MTTPGTVYVYNNQHKLAMVCVQQGRRLRVGQVWVSNDPRKLRAVRIVALHPIDPDVDVIVENVVTRKRTTIDAKHFTTGSRGWSLMKDVLEPVDYPVEPVIDAEYTVSH